MHEAFQKIVAELEHMRNAARLAWLKSEGLSDMGAQVAYTRAIEVVKRHAPREEFAWPIEHGEAGA